MKNALRSIFVVVTLFITLNLSSQNNPFRFGVEAGFNLSNAMISNGEQNGTSFKPGYRVGVTVDYSISRTFLLQSGLSFITKGSEVEDLDYKAYDGGIPDFTHTFNQQYLQLPIYGAYKIGLTNDISFIAAFGPYFSYGIGGKTKKKLNDGIFAGGGNEQKYNTFGDNDEFYYEELKRFDWGLAARIAIEYKQFVFNVGYMQGLSDISKNDNYKYRNYSLAFSIGYKF